MFFKRKMSTSKDESNQVAAPAPDAQPSLETPPIAAVPAAAPSGDSPAKPSDPRRRRRPGAGKTRLMGFDTSDGRVVELLDTEAETAQSGRCAFPVGWVIVANGPGRGECFAVLSGMSQIGRGEDQTVQLDFGDMAISRSNHAAIVYDPAEHTFLLGHGGKANLVRLNGKPLVSTETLNDGDTIEIGETSLLFKALCGNAFNWDQEDEQGVEDDVEIA